MVHSYKDIVNINQNRNSESLYSKSLFTRSKFSSENWSKFFDRKFTQRKLCQSYHAYTIKVWSNFDQSFYPKLTFGGKFKDKQNG